MGRSHFWGEALFGEKPFSGRSHFRGETIFGEKPLKKAHVRMTPLLSPLCTVTDMCVNLACCLDTLEQDLVILLYYGIRIRHGIRIGHGIRIR